MQIYSQSSGLHFMLNFTVALALIIGLALLWLGRRGGFVAAGVECGPGAVQYRLPGGGGIRLDSLTSWVRHPARQGWQGV